MYCRIDLSYMGSVCIAIHASKMDRVEDVALLRDRLGGYWGYWGLKISKSGVLFLCNMSNIARILHAPLTGYLSSSIRVSMTV